jgi:hypothetical protein
MTMKQQNSHEVIKVFVRSTSLKTLCLGFGLGAGLFVIWSRQVALGYITGALISLVYFYLMASDADGMGSRDAGAAKRFIITRYSLRFLILFSAVVAVVRWSDFNVLAVFAGVFAVQTVFVGEKLVSGILLRKPMKV